MRELCSGLVPVGERGDELRELRQREHLAVGVGIVLELRGRPVQLRSVVPNLRRGLLLGSRRDSVLELLGGRLPVVVGCDKLLELRGGHLPECDRVHVVDIVLDLPRLDLLRERGERVHELRGGVVPGISRRVGVRSVSGRELQLRRSVGVQRVQRGVVPGERRRIGLRGVPGGELLRDYGPRGGFRRMRGGPVRGGVGHGLFPLLGGCDFGSERGLMLGLHARILPAVIWRDDLYQLSCWGFSSEHGEHGLRSMPSG